MYISTRISIITFVTYSIYLEWIISQWIYNYIYISVNFFLLIFDNEMKNTFSNGCLGSHNDEERSEMRYVLRIACFRESSKFWTQLAPFIGYICWSICFLQQYQSNWYMCRCYYFGSTYLDYKYFMYMILVILYFI